MLLTFNLLTIVRFRVIMTQMDLKPYCNPITVYILVRKSYVIVFGLVVQLYFDLMLESRWIYHASLGVTESYEW